jgi:GDPmannose 4,6-dehydratase
MAARRALITGITGMVGSHLAEFLLERTDWDIVGMCRWRSPLDNLASIAWRINAGDRVSLLYGDLRDTMSIQNVVANAKPDYVFHLAAQSFPRTSFDAPLDTMDTNVQGTVRVLDALKQHAPKAIIHVCASSEVFGRVPREKLPIDEECTFHPASPYAISKVGNLQSLRTVADVRDAVRAYYMLVTVNPTAGAYYNIGGNHSCTVKDILDTLISFSPCKADIRVEVDPDRLRPIDADLQVPNIAKFQAHTGWKPEIPYDKTLRDLLDYWRDRVATEGDRFLTR